MGVLRTALYCRLSKDDMAQGDSESIRTQKAIASWTDRGRAKPSRSCFNAFCRVLIKSQCLLCA